jgi:hypothetical protein
MFDMLGGLLCTYQEANAFKGKVKLLILTSEEEQVWYNGDMKVRELFLK